jgi:hypothetical protein
MPKAHLKFALITGLVVTSYITFTLVAVNVGFKNDFIFKWFRSWLIAYMLAVPSLLFVAPFIRKKLNLYNCKMKEECLYTIINQENGNLAFKVFSFTDNGHFDHPQILSQSTKLRWLRSTNPPCTPD